MNITRKILHIEDSEIDLFITKKILNECADEFEIISSVNPEQGIKMAIECNPDLILLNYLMPVLNGLQVMEYFNEHKIKIPVIMLTSSLEPGVMMRAYKMGVIQFLSKPLMRNHFDNQSLVSIIKKYHNQENEPTVEIIKEVEIGLIHIDNKLKVIKLFKDGRYEFIDSESSKYKLFYPIFSESAQLKEKIEEFEYLINKQGVRESELQEFFERNPDFILNDDYEKAHPHVTLTNEDNIKLIPDFVLEPYNPNLLCDLLEIKLPNVKRYTLRKNRDRFSSAIFDALSQLREYAAVFENPVNRNKIYNKFGLNIYKPNMIVIIGRAKEMEPYALKRITSDLPSLKVITYDDIFDKMKRRIQ